MLENSWCCTACKHANPSRAELCRECGMPASSSKGSSKPTTSDLRSRWEGGVSDNQSRFSMHPVAGFTLVFLVSALFLLNFFPSSPVAEPGFVVILFAMGLPSIVQIVLGFASVFGPAFFSLGARDKAMATVLAALLVLPSMGGVVLIFVFVNELRFQLSCSGGACAQGGMATLIFGAFSWIGSFIACDMSKLFTRWGWWPAPLKPNFGAFG